MTDIPFFILNPFTTRCCFSTTRDVMGYERLGKNNVKFENAKELIDTCDFKIYLFRKSLTNTGASEVYFIPVSPKTKKGYPKVSLMYKSIIYVNDFL